MQLRFSTFELDAIAKIGSGEQLLFNEFARRLHLRLAETIDVKVTQDAFAAVLKQRHSDFRQRWSGLQTLSIKRRADHA